jgi:C4-type Zn-finger protein
MASARRPVASDCPHCMAPGRRFAGDVPQGKHVLWCRFECTRCGFRWRQSRNECETYFVWLCRQLDGKTSHL